MRLFYRLVRFIKEIKWISFFRVLFFTKEPIFIVGCERSGTTLLLSILGSHPNIYAIPFETNIYWYHGKRKNTLFNKLFRRKKILGHLFKQNIPFSSKRFCEKTPRHILYIKEILYDYKNKVKIIHIIRDGRDVITSVHPDYPERNNFVSVEDWKHRVGSASKYINHPNVLTVKYEDLINCCKETMILILGFLKEPYHNNIDEFYLNTNVKTHSAWAKGVSPLFEDSVNKHKKFKKSEDVLAFERNLESMNLLKLYGYS